MLELHNVKKTFNKGTINEKKALQGLELTLQSEDFVTIIGGNGAGKSTMLNMIAGVYPIDEGKIILDGTDISRKPEYARAKYLGRVFQDPMKGTAAGMEIQENLALAYRRGKKRGLKWAIGKDEQVFYKEQLKALDLGLEDRMTSKVGLLSGGQRQALTLLMASLQKPQLLLLDEHTAALDPKTAAKVLALTEKIIAEHHLTAMMVTHNMKDAIRLGNRLIMMHEGRIIYDVAGELIRDSAGTGRTGFVRHMDGFICLVDPAQMHLEHSLINKQIPDEERVLEKLYVMGKEEQMSIQRMSNENGKQVMDQADFMMENTMSDEYFYERKADTVLDSIRSVLGNHELKQKYMALTIAKSDLLEELGEIKEYRGNSLLFERKQVSYGFMNMDHHFLRQDILKQIFDQ